MGAASLWGETPAAVRLTAVVWVGVIRCGGRAGTICASLGAWGCRHLSITCHGEKKGRSNSGAGVALQPPSAGSDWFKLCCF